MKLILASQSPRRKEILINAGYNPIIEVSNVNEDVKSCNVEETVRQIALKKCQSIYQKHLEEDAVILAADTVVYINNQILGKPQDKEDACKMITLIQGKTHYVLTAAVIKSKDFQKIIVEKTKVKVMGMSNMEIQNYINTPEPYDKAGGYAIQGIFSKYIEAIEGDYYNVMGLPICKVNQILRQLMK